jgi:hypothetical protein
VRGGEAEEREVPLGANQGALVSAATPRPLTTRPASSCRRLADATPGIAPLDFRLATVTNSNLGGLCGLTCSGKWDHDNDGATTKVRRYDADSGLCTYEAGTAGDVAAAPPCLAAHEMYYTGLATTQSGTQVDLRVTNTTGYLPFRHTANGLRGVWGAVQVLGNTETDFLFEFIDNVRTAHACPHGPQCLA